MSDPYVAERLRMVSQQLEARGIHDPAVLRAMREVPRHEFVPLDLQSRSYRDSPLPIGEGQTISQPYMVALMTQSAQVKPHHRVLEIGTGCGYQAAILGVLAKVVYSIERIPELAEGARLRLLRLGYQNVHVVVANGTLGLPSSAPYDAILVGAGSPSVPPPLLEQLAAGGRLVIPVQEGMAQILHVCTRTEAGVKEERGEACTFVPLIGEHGWAK